MNGALDLYDPSYEQDSCGVGLAVNISGVRDHRIVEYGLRILENWHTAVRRTPTERPETVPG